MLRFARNLFFPSPLASLRIKEEKNLSAVCTGDTDSPHMSSLYTVDILDIASRKSLIAVAVFLVSAPVTAF